MAPTAMTTYGIEVFHEDRSNNLVELQRAVASELRDLGLHRTVTVAVAESAPIDDAPVVGVWLGSPAAKANAALAERAAARVAAGGVVIPVLDDLASFSIHVPDSLAFANGTQWSNDHELRSLVRILLEELGIEERQRRVFISHRREDGLMAAERIHDRLTHHRFIPFIDRFAIPAGDEVQERIADALEDHAFMVLLETPEAHGSSWVYDELEYALSHGMGILIFTWPDVVVQIPGSVGLPRVHLAESEVERDAHGFVILTEAALDSLVGTVEAAHASSLCRRRRYLIKSIQDSAMAAGASMCIPLRDWRVLIEHNQVTAVVGTTPRLPTAFDLQGLVEATASEPAASQSVLVHSARTLRPALRQHLGWVAGERDVTVVPENAIGGHW